MQLSLQPFTTAGIALVGASAIALSPLAPPPVTTSATMPVSTAAVQLSAAVDPLTRWGQVIEASAANLNELADYYMDRPLPIATEVFKNVQTYADILASGFQAGAMNLQNWANTIMGPAIQKAAGELSAGNIELAAKTFTSALGQVIFQLTPMMSMLTIPQTVNDHIHAVVDEIFQITTLSTPVGLPITLINDTIRSLASSMQGSVDAFEAGDIPTAMAAIANAPAELATALLNDRGGLIDFERRGSAGTLITGGAVLNMLIKLPRRIADKLVIPPTTAAATGAPLAISGPSTPELPTVGGPAIDLAPSPAPDTAATGAAEPDKGDTLPAVVVGSTGATDLSVANKVEDETAKAPSAQRVKTSLRNAADKVDERIKKLSTGIEKSVKKVSDNIAKAGKKKTAGGSASSASASDKAGTDSDD